MPRCHSTFIACQRILAAKLKSPEANASRMPCQATKARSAAMEMEAVIATAEAEKAAAVATAAALSDEAREAHGVAKAAEVAVKVEKEERAVALKEKEEELMGLKEEVQMLKAALGVCVVGVVLASVGVTQGGLLGGMAKLCGGL